MDISKILIQIAGLLVVLFVEMWVVGWGKSSISKIYNLGLEVRIDIFNYFLKVTKINTYLGLLFTLFIPYGVAKFIGYYHLHLEGVFLLGGIQASIVYFLLFDFLCYGFHYLAHKSEVLFVFHSYHHSAREMNVLNNLRSHPFEAAISQLFIQIPLLLVLNVEPEYAIFWAALGKLHSDMYHSALYHDWGFIGRYILVSPAAHRVHHCDNKEYFGRNFGNHLIVWDNIFGTAIHIGNLESEKLNFRLVDYSDESNKILGCLRNFFNRYK
jgi:sterol desaturase/sphingolipid hydroxylase (fatty acid hydroxylase superfamily)